MDHVAFVFQTNKLFHQTSCRQRARRAARCHAMKKCEPPSPPPSATTSWRSCRRVSTPCSGPAERIYRAERSQRVALARAILEGRAHRRARRGDRLRRPRERGPHPACLRASGLRAHGHHDRPQALDRRAARTRSWSSTRGASRRRAPMPSCCRRDGLYAKMWAEYERAASWKIAAAAEEVVAAKGGEA